MKFCVYLTIYKGKSFPPKLSNSDIFPRRYIGSSQVEIVQNGYKGSVCSKQYRNIWIKEIRDNPHLFKTRILSYHNNREEALSQELSLHRKYDVRKNPYFFNRSIAQPKGYFGASSEMVTKETRKKMSNVRKGKTYEEIFGVEEAARLRELRRTQRNGMKGKKLSEEAKAKLKESKKGQFFITNGVQDKKVKGEIPEGWWKGRTNGLKGIHRTHICPSCSKQIKGSANFKKHQQNCLKVSPF